MKAPDKIYFNPKFDIPQREKECSDDIEYLRKDALLEWANSEMSHEQGYTTEDAECAYRHALQDLVTKINSM